MDVTFFPRNDYPNNIEICNHRLGKSMTYTEQSDTFRGGAEAITSYAESKGIKLGVFWGMSDSQEYAEIAKPLLENKKLWIDAYCHPTNSQVSGTIITREVYEEERDDLWQRIGDFFGIRPVAMSYNSGNTSYADYIIPDFLAGRNSGRNGGTPYGSGLGSPNNISYSTSYFKSKESTSRWYDDAKSDSSFSARLQQLESDVLTTKLNHGWYNNFTHWHNVISDGNLQAYKDYLDLLATLNQNNDIYFAGYGEAVSYLVYRQIITKCVMYSPIYRSNSQLVIRLETNKGELNVDTELLTVPISVKFSTLNTPLENQSLICIDRNLVSLGNNEYIVEIPFDRFPIATINKVAN